MSKLAKKFLFSISIVLISIILLALLINIKFVERYYIYQKKGELDVICNYIKNSTEPLDEIIEELENSEKVVIVTVNNTSNNNILNQEIQAAFLERGFAFQNYWLWEVDYQNTIKNNYQLRIYKQEKLNYNLMIEYVNLEETFVAVAMIIPNISETISLINKLMAAIFGMATVLIILLVYFLVKRITTPLAKISELAIDISAQNFKQIEINTHDELEILANNINDMSNKLQSSQKSLQDKNHQMETLLANVSHDLKTPVALIKAYSAGIKDGIDDGTFLDTIVNQNNNMEKMIERLLELSRMQQKDLPTESIDLDELLKQKISEQALIIKKKGISLIQEIEFPLMLVANSEAVSSIFENLLSNAIKYTKNQTIKVSLHKEDDKIVFLISNGISNKSTLIPNRLWEPFYVGEESRNKKLSGTGLGLSIVKTYAEKQGYHYDCTINNNEIVFKIVF